MALFVTYHSAKLPSDYMGWRMPVLGAQDGDGFAIANGAKVTVPAKGLYWIGATSDCRVRCGPGLANATGGRTWSYGYEQVFYLSAGDVIACDALA